MEVPVAHHFESRILKELGYMIHHQLFSCYTVLLLIFVTACGNSQKQPDPQPSGQSGKTSVVKASPVISNFQNTPERLEGREKITMGEAAGVRWSVPSRWQEQPSRTMLVATYLIPKSVAEEEPGECAVFFFGQGQGGSVELNLQRWQNQFEAESGGSPTPAQRKTSNNSKTVTTESLAGTYLATMGHKFQSGTVKKPNYKMLGAIAEAPRGNVFFKLTGPEKTIMGAETEFHELLNSLKK